MVTAYLGPRGTFSEDAAISYAGPDGAEVALSTTTPVQTLNELTGRALAEGFELRNLEVRRPTLEDVYLELTEPAEPPA